jgi:hypothetical protein
LFANPNNQAAIEHFDQMKNRWTGNVERLRALVDEAVDTPALIKAASSPSPSILMTLGFLGVYSFIFLSQKCNNCLKKWSN